MLTNFVLAAVILTVFSLRPPTQQPTVSESPFACNTKALDNTERQRWMALLVQLNTTKQEVRELPNGYAFRFPADTATIQTVAEFIAYERRCCPFFDLELAVTREGGPLWLRFMGRDGVKAFIKAEFKL